MKIKIKKEKEPLAFAKIKYYVYEEEEEKCRANITLFLKATEGKLIGELRDNTELFGQGLYDSWGYRDNKINYRYASCSISAISWNELEQKINEKLQETKERLQQILKRNRELRKTMPKEKQVVLL